MKNITLSLSCCMWLVSNISWFPTFQQLYNSKKYGKLPCIQLINTTPQGQQPDSMPSLAVHLDIILSQGSSFHSLVYILNVTLSNYKLYSAMNKFTIGNGYNNAKLLRKFVVATGIWLNRISLSPPGCPRCGAQS